MNIQTLELKKTDIVIISHNVEAVPPKDVDKYCENLLQKLVEVFGKGQVALIPVFRGDPWEFIVVKKVE